MNKFLKALGLKIKPTEVDENGTPKRGASLEVVSINGGKPNLDGINLDGLLESADGKPIVLSKLIED
jgi:hypothetical protein